MYTYTHNRPTWKQFRPHHKGYLHDQTTFEVDTIYAESRQIVDETLQQVRNVKLGRGQMKRITKAAQKLAEHGSVDPAHLLAQLVLSTPGAARAQVEMDHHKGGYANQRARLFELIGFNDLFDETVLTLPESYLADFPERLKNEMTVFCRRMRVGMFTDRQYEAIVHGLSREIALFRAAKKLGYRVRMTSRLQDAMGVDMVITDPTTKRSLNIDCKTSSSYHFRLLDLKKEHRIDEGQRLRGELEGFCKVRNGEGHSAIDTVLFRLATEDLGGIVAFDYVELAPLQSQLERAMAKYGAFVV